MTGTVYRSRKGPRVNSWAYLALRQLHQDGGETNLGDWMASIGWRLQQWRFRQDVVELLAGLGLIQNAGAVLKVTASGLEFLGEATVPPAREKPSIVPGKYVAPMRPLSLKNMPRPCVVRPGAFDYRDIPSRHGDTLVPYKSNVKLADEVSNG